MSTATLLAAIIDFLIDYSAAITTIALVAFFAYTLFTRRGIRALSDVTYNLVSAAFLLIAELLAKLGPNLNTVKTAFLNAFRMHGTEVRNELETEFASFAKWAFTSVTQNLEKHHDVKPGQWKDIASEAIADAYGFGMASWAVTAGFEAMFPEKLNVLNGTGSIMEKLAGFQEVTSAVLKPMLTAGIATPAAYDANSKFRSVLPSVQAALFLWARRLLSDADAKHVLECHGFSDSWDSPMFNGAYRPVNPRALATLMQNQPFDRTRMRQILEGNAYSPQDVTFLLDQFEYASTKQLRQSYVNEALIAYQHGVLPDQELDTILNSLGWSDEARKFIHERAALARRVILAQKVEQQIVPLVAQGLLTPQVGTAHMEAAGIQPWYTDLEITLATTKAELHAARLEAAAEERARLATLRNLTNAAIAEYQAGRIPLAVLSTELAAIGLEPSQVASITAVQEAQTHGRMKYLYGQVLTPDDAAVLKDRVSAIEQQFKDNFLTLEQGHNQLAELNVPKPQADALLARWAGSMKKTPGSAVQINPLTGQFETKIAA